jgi:hypothetical protein
LVALAPVFAGLVSSLSTEASACSVNSTSGKPVSGADQPHWLWLIAEACDAHRIVLRADPRFWEGGEKVKS